MLDMGFFDDIADGRARSARRTRQTLLFSATYPGRHRQAQPRSSCATRVEVKVEAQHDGSKIEQRCYEVKRDASACTPWRCCSSTSARSARWRSATPRRSAASWSMCCRPQGFSALALHGDLEQRERDQVLVQFANRSCSVLVATDVAARGLDIAQLEAVINVDVTPDPEVHIHRIGRTGRAGEAGLALNLASLRRDGARRQDRAAAGPRIASGTR